MNDLSEVNFQFPETIDDLTKWDMFFSARIPLYKKLLKNVKSWDEASEEEKRILRRAQEEAENLIDIHTVMGEMYRNLPEESGGDKKSADYQADINVGLKTAKQEYREQTKLSEKKAQRFANISNHPEIVAEVKADARENNELPTETEILKRIEQARREEREKLKAELQDKQEECDYLESQLEEIKAKDKEILVQEVPPKDYEELKRKAEMSDIHEKDFRTMQKAYEEMSEKWKKAEKEKDELIKKANEPKEQYKNNLERDVRLFCMGIKNFLEQYGSYTFLDNDFNNLTKEEKKMLHSAIRKIQLWADDMLNSTVMEAI